MKNDNGVVVEPEPLQRIDNSANVLIHGFDGGGVFRLLAGTGPTGFVPILLQQVRLGLKGRMNAVIGEVEENGFLSVVRLDPANPLLRSGRFDPCQLLRSHYTETILHSKSHPVFFENNPPHRRLVTPGLERNPLPTASPQPWADAEAGAAGRMREFLSATQGLVLDPGRFSNDVEEPVVIGGLPMPDSFPDLQSLESATLPDGRVVPRERVTRAIDSLLSQLSEREQAYFQMHAERFTETMLRLAPLVRPETRLLVVGDWCCFASALARDLFDLRDITTLDRKDGRLAYRLSGGLAVGFDRLGADLEKERWPIDDASRDLVLSQEILEHFVHDPMPFMLEAHRVLAEGGVLVTTTPNAASLQSIWNAVHGRNPYSFGVYGDGAIEHPKEYAPDELAAIHENAGLSPVRHETFSPYGKPDLPKLREALHPFGFRDALAGQVQFLAAEKIGSPRFRKFGPLHTTRLAFGDPAEREIPDVAAHTHQWWGDCPHLDSLQTAERAMGDDLFPTPVSASHSSTGPSSDQWPRSLMSTGARRLIRACLLPREIAEPEFERWRESEDLDSQSTQVIKLIPALYRRLLEWERTDLPEIDRYKGIHRYHWAMIRSLLRQKDQLVGHLAGNGIPTMLLKGAALNLAYYHAPAIRPMDDYDLMVPAERGAEAVRLLEDMGWKMVGRIPTSRDDREFSRYLHALAFRSPRDGALLDLHWHLSQFHLRPEDDTFFWERSRELPYGDATVRIPTPENLVFHFAAHLVHYSSSPGLHWPLDFVRVIDAEGEAFDWDQLAAVAEHSQMTEPVARFLRFLRDDIGLDDRIPEIIVRSLSNKPVSTLRRWEVQAARKPLPRHSTFLQRLPANLLAYQRFSAGRPLPTRVRELGPFLRVVNFYDHDPLRQGWVNARREFANRKNALRRHWRARQRKALAGDITHYPESHLDGFHLKEPFEDSILRWTQCSAVVRFDRPPEPCQVRIRLAKVRSDADLRKSLGIRFNSRKIETVTVEENEIRLTLPTSAFVKGTLQTLHLHCDEMPTGGVDARELGLPVLGVDFIPFSDDA